MTKKSFALPRHAALRVWHAGGTLLGVALLPIGAGWFLLRKHFPELAAITRGEPIDDKRTRSRLANETAAAIATSLALTASLVGVLPGREALDVRLLRTAVATAWPLALTVAAYPLVTYALGTLRGHHTPNAGLARGAAALVFASTPWAFLAARGEADFGAVLAAFGLCTVAFAAGASWITEFSASTPWLPSGRRLAVHGARVAAILVALSAFFVASPLRECRQRDDATCPTTELPNGIATRGPASTTVTASRGHVLIETFDGGGAGRVESPHPIERAYLARCQGVWEISVHTSYGVFCTSIDERGVRRDDGFTDRLLARPRWLHASTLVLLLASTFLLGARRDRG